MTTAQSKKASKWVGTGRSPVPVDEMSSRHRPAVQKDELREAWRQRVVGCMDRLTRRQSEVAWLHFVEGMDQRTVARVLNLSPSTVCEHVTSVKRIFDIVRTEERRCVRTLLREQNEDE